MSFFTQICLGLLPGVILFIILTAVQKKHKARNIAMLVTFSLIALTALGGNLFFRPRKAETELLDEAAKRDFLVATATESSNELVAGILKTYRNIDDNADITLLDAYLHAESGDARGALALYRKACEEKKTEPEEEFKELCTKALEEQKNGDGKSLDRLAEKARSLMDDLASRCSDSFIKAAKYLDEAEKLYQSYLSGEDFDSKKIEKLAKKMDQLTEEDPRIAELPQIRKASMKLSVLEGDYQKVAASLSDKATSEELLIVSELYINDLFDDSSFPDGFGENDLEEYERVAAQVEKVREKLPEDSADYQTANELADELDRAIESPKAYHLRKLISGVANDENASDAPKASLQLSRIEYKDGYEHRAEDYLTDSLNTIGLCDDEDFTRPANEIISAISDKDDPEKLKNVAENVNALVENSSDEVVYQAAAWETPEEKDSSYTSFATDYSSHKRASLNITHVDTSEFETIIATVNVDTGVSMSAEELKRKITVTDCGHEITEFEIEKIEYQGANILLCCDVSGSMDGRAIQSLRSAVAEFVQSSSKIENIALAPFSSYLETIYPFGTPKRDISDAASNLYASGGTNMYDTLIDVQQYFTIRTGEINMVLLLSDGEDNTLRSEADIRSYIGAPYTSDGIVIYALGLGDSVNADYMQTIASSTGGSYQYVMDDTTLDSFYQRLREQILNQYTITFKAENTISMSGRELTITLKDDNMCTDTEIYSIGDELTPDDQNRASVISMKGRSISGLDTKRIYRSSSSVKINLMGTGFKEDDTMTFRLEGNLSYSADCEYVSDTCVAVTIPAGIACDTYDVVFTVNSGKAILDDELIVTAPGTEKITQFGPYVFTSCDKSVSGDKTILSGYVTMNGWLTFRGDVVLTGDLSSYQINLTDLKGSYIRYYEDTVEGGYAKTLAEQHHVLSVPALGTVRLYNDPNADAGSEDYTSDYSIIPTMYMADVAELEMPGVSLLPKMIKIKTDAFDTKFPFQDKLLKAAGYKPLFSFDASLTGKITATKIGMLAEVSVGDKREEYTPVNFGSMPIYVSKSSCKLKLDTEKNEYEIKLGTKVAFIDSDGLSLRLAWTDKAGGAASFFPSTIEIGSDTKIDSFIGSVPVTYHDFKLKFDNININDIWKIKLVGSFDLDVAQLHDFLPGVSKWLGDPSLLKLDDITATLAFGDMYISLGAKLKLLDEIELGDALIEAGKLSYTNYLLDMKNETAYGLQASLSCGVKWETENCDIDIGGTNRFSAHSKFIGCELDGDCHIDIEWWVIEKDFDASGKAVLGVYWDHSGRANFIVKVRGTNKDGTAECYIVWNSDDFDFGVKKL